MFVLYNLLLLFFSPLVAVYYIYRVVWLGKSKKAWRQQLGGLPDSLRREPGRPRIWMHAVSVGEAVASGPVLRELKALMPDVEIIVSTTTTTGQDMVKKSLSEVDQTLYFPLDYLPIVRKSIAVVRPDVFVSMESEIWPNFLAEIRRNRIPALIVNGIVSDKTVKWGRRLRFLYRWALSNVSQVLMQTEQDAKRIISLGALPEKVSVVGNCKFDQEVDPLSSEECETIRQRYKFPVEAPVFIAGSTNPGEDEPVIEAFKIARKTHPDLRMIIAPRQIDRAEAIADMVRAEEFTCGQRSASEDLTGTEDVVILDTFGELATVYGIGDVAFVGGNLIPKGGHNILQPIAQGKPVFFGPYMFKSRDLARQAKAAGVGFQIADGEELGNQMVELLSDRPKLEALRVKALDMIRTNKGASKRCAEAIVLAMSNE